MELNLNDPRAQHAITALCITLPIYRAEIADDGAITFYVYGGQALTCSPPKPKPALRRTEPALAIAQPPAQAVTHTAAPKRRTPKKEVPQNEPIR